MTDALAGLEGYYPSEESNEGFIPSPAPRKYTAHVDRPVRDDLIRTAEALRDITSMSHPIAGPGIAKQMDSRASAELTRLETRYPFTRAITDISKDLRSKGYNVARCRDEWFMFFRDEVGGYPVLDERDGWLTAELHHSKFGEK